MIYSEHDANFYALDRQVHALSSVFAVSLLLQFDLLPYADLIYFFGS